MEPTRIITGAVVTVGCAALLQSCGGDAGVEHSAHAAHSAIRNVAAYKIVTLPPESASAEPLQFAEAHRRAMPVSCAATGQLQADANAVSRISSPIAGKVVDVKVAVGNFVAKGQTVLVVASEEIAALEAELFHQETDIDSALSQDLLQIDCDLDQARAEAKLSEKQYDRANILLAEKVGSQAQLDMARTGFEKEKIIVQSLEQKRKRLQEIAVEKKRILRNALVNKLRLLGMHEATIQKIIANKNVDTTIPIIAPRSGVVLDRLANIGEIVEPSKTLMVVDDLDTLWLVADIFEQDIEKMQVGDPVDFHVDSFPAQDFHCVISYIASAVNPETRTLAVRADVPNAQHHLKPKMFARMLIKVGNQLVMTVPKTAVQEAGSTKVVYVPTKTGFEERPVKVDGTKADLIQVLDGLHEGEKVVTKGSFALRGESLKTE